MELPEIKTIYKQHKLTINNKTFTLVYEVVQYKKIPYNKQNKKYINRIKDNIEIKKLGIKKDKEVTTAYYKFYCKKEVPIKYRKILVDKILNINIDNDFTLIEDIKYKWSNKNYHKNKTQTLKDNESIILEILGSYLIGSNKENIIKNSDRQKFKKIEQNLSNPENDNTKLLTVEKNSSSWEIQNNNNFSQKTSKKWKQSKTYKLFNLYTYDNHKNNVIEYDWVNSRYRDYTSHHVRIDRLIDKEKPYKAEWCVVDTEGLFKFKGNKFKISNKLKQYKKRKWSYDMYKSEFKMDKILVFEQDNKMFFFDQDINKINKRFIVKL